MGWRGRLWHSSKVIQITTLSGNLISVNPDLIRTIESTPDTILCFVDGLRMPVKESQKEIQQKIIDFKREIGKQSWM
jgi:flagellar protein FlbD